ncbi:hypothetical protein F5884DRAFT_636324, partial [Xylogone sp. PMI_703]
MGRRKIEIKAIKDYRNRSVTFLKRKGGLFKKAHELSVLCSVDIVVLIVGRNKKVYEYSNSDVSEILARYQCACYGSEKEHKGPLDFKTKNPLDDDDRGINACEPSQTMDIQLQNQSDLQHSEQSISFASTTIPNDVASRLEGEQPRARSAQPTNATVPFSK